MLINNVIFNIDCINVVDELQSQCRLNGLTYLSKIVDTPHNVQVCCPYHKDGQEKYPSAGIKKTDGTFHCFACGEVHSLPEVISYCLGYSDDTLGKHGWEWLLKNFKTIAVENRAELPLDLSRSPRENNTIKYVSESELMDYRQYHPYMWKRKMTPSVVDRFDIGYDSDTQCLTFPVRDLTGGTLFIARRSVNTKFFNYPSGAEKPLYGLYELSRVNFGKTVYLCESMIDCLTLWSWGYKALALNGLGNDFQFKQLQDIPVRAFILCTDMDKAGISARSRIKRNVPNKMFYDLFWDYTGVKDINDMTQEQFESLMEVM